MSKQYQKQKAKWKEQGRVEERERILKILKKGKIKDVWGYDIIQGDWEGLIKEITQNYGDKK